MNDPFGRSDRTIILPDPGGRRRPPEPPSQPTPYPSSRHRVSHPSRTNWMTGRVPKPRRARPRRQESGNAPAP